MDENMKKCQYCGEEILKKAIKCKHCGEMLQEHQTINDNGLKKCPVCAEMISVNDSFCKLCESSLVDTNENYSNKDEQKTNGSEFEFTIKTPNEVKKWNWGAFWATWVWGIFNKSFLTFLVFIPYFGFLWMIVCGLKGNEWAWKNKKWSSVAEFEKSQYKWALVTNIIATITILISLVLCLAIFNTGQETQNQVVEAPIQDVENRYITVSGIKVYLGNGYADEEIAKIAKECYAFGNTNEENLNGCVENYLNEK